MTGLLSKRWVNRWAIAVLGAAMLLAFCAAFALALSPPVGTVIPNTATARFTGANGYAFPDVPSNRVETAIGGAPVLAITAVATPDPTAPGGTLTYMITVSNTGNLPASAVTVAATLSPILQFQGASNGGISSPPLVTWNLGAIGPGGGVTFTLTAVVAAGTLPGTVIPFTASTTSAEGAANSATLTTTVGAGSNLVFEKSGAPETVAPNGVITYALSYRNIGNQTANGVRIVDSIPSGTAYVAGSASAFGSLTGSVISWNIGDVAAGGAGEVSFRVRVSPVAVSGQQISNTASILSTAQTKTSNTVVTNVSTPSLLLLKLDTPDPVRAGNNIVYTLQVENTGSIPLTGIVLSDPIPVGTTFVSAGNGGVAAAGARQVDWAIGALAAGAKQTVTLTVQVDKALVQGQVIENTATASSNEMPPRTVRAVSVVSARTQGTIEFFDAAWQPAYAYRSGNAVNLQVLDADQNLNPLVAETVTVVLTDSKTGDTETVIMTETGPDTGIFRGGVTSSLAASAANSGILTVSANSRVTATYSDALDAVVVSTASALIDPLGIVFNSVTGAPVAGTVVTLRNWNGVANSCDLTSWPVLPPGEVNPAVPTGADGKFAFPLVPPGDFCFQVTPSAGYTFPSAVAASDLPAGFTIGNGSRGEKFTLNVGDPPLIRDIPVDPPTGRLTIAKTASKTTAAIGDMLTYVLNLTNNGSSPVNSLTITDIMPHGLAYIAQSTKTNGVASADPQTAGKRTFAWTIASLAPAASVEIAYRVLVGPDSQAGTGINTATAAGLSLGKTVVSNTASVKVKITEGVFTSKGTIIGRVFLDLDENRLAGKDSGIPDVALYLEDGTRVVTDKRGRFSISGVSAGTHVLRLDETTLPAGAKLIPLNNRFMRDGASQFVDMTPGGLFKANFAVQKGSMILKAPAPEAQKEKQEQENTEQQGRTLVEALSDIFSSVPASRKAVSSKASPAGAATVEGPPVKKPEEMKASVSTRVASDPQEEAKASSAMPDAAATKEAPAVKTSAEPKTDQTPPAESRPAAKEENEADAGAEKVSAEKEAGLEERIKTFSPDLEFLNLRDQEVAARKNIRVVVKAPLDTELTLTVNGDKVDNRQIGKQIKYAPGKVAIYEFINIPLKTGEENLITAEVRDPFGNVRSSQTIRIKAAGDAARMVIRPERTEAPADGQSKISVNVSLEDREGQIATFSGSAAVSLSAGEILEKDADPLADGHQILIRNGVAQFTVVSPRETGEAKIEIQVNDVSESVKIYFLPHLRPMLMVGVGEVVLGNGRSSGDLDYIKSRSWFNDGAYVNGRGAFFMKGNVFKDFLLTASYDSNKNKTDELFRESDTRLDSEEKYPIYGDESKTGYEALSREKLYVKLEKGKSYLLYGDYRTDLTETTLAAYTRSFNGLSAEVNTDRFRLRSFGTHTDQSQFVDTLPGKGISGYYYLNNNTIIEGSERVVIETRDRLQPDRVLNREVKSNGSDYDIDYAMGTILFKAPVPSHDADGNPVYIVATYESRQEGSKYYIYGGRGAFKVTDWLQVGATGVIEENAISNYQLFGGDIALKLPGKTLVKAEYVNTRGLFDINNTYAAKDGEGWSVNVESQPLNRLSVNGFYRNMSDYFSNPSATDAVRGTQKFGFDAAYEIQPSLTLRAKYLDEQDRINNSTHRLASVGATKKFVKTKISAELTHETSDNLTVTPAQTPFTPGGLLNGVPFLNAYETPDQATFARVELERELLTDLSLTLSHKQDLGGNSYFVSQGGLNYKINEFNRLYLREEYAKYQQGTQTRTLIGAESSLVKNTTAYSEFRLADGSAGYRNQQVIGLKNKFQIIRGLNANIAGEYLSTLSGQKNPNEPDAYAAAASMDYLAKEDLKITGRAEHRHEIVENGTDSYLAEVAAAYKLHPDFSLLVRERYFIEKKGGDQNDTNRLLLGLAYRPLENDRFNALGKVEYKYDKRGTAQPTYGTDSFIASAEGVYQLTQTMQVMGKYAGKLEKDEDFSSYTDLMAARIMIDLTDRFDFGAEYRLLTSHKTNTRQHGGSVEFGCRIVDQIWLSLGYSFDRFDEDLAGDSYHGEGPYLKVRFKFDEKTLRKLNPLADKNSSSAPQAAASIEKALSSYLSK